MGRILGFVGYWYFAIPFVAGIFIQSQFHQNYQSVWASLIASILLFIVLFIQTYIYPRKKISLFGLFLLVACLPLISLFRFGTYESGDFNLHIYRIMSFYDSLREGNIMPSWAAHINATYGNPIFIFNYSLPYYIVSVLHFIGFSFVTSMKIMLGSTFFFSGIFMYIAIRKILNNELAAFTGALIYLFAPYHLSDFHFRATPGEMTLLMLAPLMFYLVTCYFKVQKFRYLILISLTTLLLSASHPMVSITVHFLVFIFAISYPDFKKRLRLLIALYLAIFVGFVASLYIWLPFLIYLPIMYPPVSLSHPYNPFYQLFYSPFKYGLLFQGPKGELTTPIGYAQILFIVIGIYFLVKKRILKKNKVNFIVWILTLLLFVFLMHPSSDFLWSRFKLLWMLSDRLLLPITICVSFIASYVALTLQKKRKILLFLLLFITIFSTILNWGHRRVISTMGDRELVQYAPTATNFLEGPGVYFANTKWANKNQFWFEKIPNSHLEVPNNQDFVHEIERTTTRHAYFLDIEKPTTFTENTLWYPGWTLSDYGKQVQIKPGKGGVITGNLNKGLHYLVFEYKDIPIYKNLKLMGLSILVILLTLLIGSLFSHPKDFARKIQKPSIFERKNKSKKRKN